MCVCLGRGGEEFLPIKTYIYALQSVSIQWSLSTRDKLEIPERDCLLLGGDKCTIIMLEILSSFLKGPLSEVSLYSAI